MEHPTYIAVIGDLIASRDLDAAERAPLQKRLSEALQRTHEQAGQGSVARPLITLGDEFQGLFAPTAAGARAVRALLDDIPEASRPLGVRFGIGIGPLSTPRMPEAIGMDGPCFHRARAALERARDTKLPCWLEAGAPAEVERAGSTPTPQSPDRATAPLWSLLACWLLRQRESWTPPQREAVRLYRVHGSWKAVAEQLGVTQGAISQRHQAADWGLTQATEGALEAALVQLAASGAEPKERR